MSDFQIGDRVRIVNHWEFDDGIEGVITQPATFILHHTSPNEWQEHKRVIQGVNQLISTYYIKFDYPADDGSGYLYLGAEIEEEYLELIKND